MTTIAQVRAQIATIGNAIPGWRASAYVEDAITVPMIKVSRPAFDPRLVFGQAKAAYVFKCVAYAPRVDAKRSETALDALAEPTGAGSFIAAIQTSSNWGSVTVDYAVVTQVGEVVVTTFGPNDTTEYLACPFDVEVVW